VLLSTVIITRWIIRYLGFGLGLLMVQPALSSSLKASYNGLIRKVWSHERTVVPNSLKGVVDSMSKEALVPTLTERLRHTEWLLEDLNGQGVLDRIQITLQFGGGDSAAEAVAGSGGCNRYFSTVQFDDAGATESIQLVTFSRVGSTRMACLPAVMDQENRFFYALQAAQRIELAGAFLYLYSDGQEQPMRFTQMLPVIPALSLE